MMIENLVGRFEELMDIFNTTEHLDKLELLNDQDIQHTAQIFLEEFDQIKYYILNQSSRPFVFAYSALVTEEVKRKTASCHFDDCFEAPLNAEKFKQEILAIVDTSIF